MLLPALAQASHIVGGEWHYECLGVDPDNAANNRYRFSLKMYRNCNSMAMDDFSDPAPFAIYSETTDGHYFFEGKWDAPVSTPVLIPPDTGNPCLQLPPDICVEEGIYEFIASLPRNEWTYHVVYQRCCRNATISNMPIPDMTGASFVIELNAEAQQLCNSSPAFREYPPVVICANEPLVYDHSAEDKEGHELRYFLCSPLEGAGVEGAFEVGDPGGCNGFRPDPPCAPPYPEITFLDPFSPSNPMGGAPQVTIDEQTGLITGMPTTLGQYVVGVCVEEYHNGELLSTVRRDFQFNVARCDPYVRAIILADDITDDAFVFRSCGDSIIHFQNNSVQEENIEEFYWSFDLNGYTITPQEWNPVVAFPGLGVYSGSLILNPGTNCGDTAEIRIEIRPQVEALFEADFDECTAGPVQFWDQSTADYSNIIEWRWNFGEGGRSNEQNPTYWFTEAGIHRVTLQIIDENGCADSYSENISYYPAPDEIIIEPSNVEACAPEVVTFTNLSYPVTEEYTIRWDFGDGSTSSALHPEHLYDQEGVYDISLYLESPIGCIAEAEWDQLIRVRPTPEAVFSYQPQDPSSVRPTIYFSNQSKRSVAHQWSFGNGESSTQFEPVYTYPDTGVYEVRLIALHEQGCLDTATQVVDIRPLVTYFMPNAFTPNGDDTNDYFLGKGFLEGIQNFRMSIFNRFGEQVFVTEEPTAGWNGRKHNGGEQAPNAVYVYVLEYETPRGRKIEQKGYVTLVR